MEKHCLICIVSATTKVASALIMITVTINHDYCIIVNTEVAKCV